MLVAVQAFCDRCDLLNVNGLDFQHAAICARRCWLHLHRASMNEWSEHIRLGSIRHGDSHQRDQSTTGLLGLSPDRLDWDRHVVIEEKPSASHLFAAEDQALFYAAMLSVATGSLWGISIYVSSKRRYFEYALDQPRLDRLNKSLDLIGFLKLTNSVPAGPVIAACAGCSNAEFCGIDR